MFLPVNEYRIDAAPELIRELNSQIITYLDEEPPAYTRAARLILRKFRSRHFSSIEDVFLYWLAGLLNLPDNTGLAEAARLLWPEQLFSLGPQCTRQLWAFFDEVSLGIVMGAASMSKTYSLAARLLLEWLRDPEWTQVILIGPSEEHLRIQLFSHMLGLHQQSRIKLPGEVFSLWIGMNRRSRMGSIFGTVIRLGESVKAGKLQGLKRRPRKKAHPKFGVLSRLFVLIDEVENVPAGLWKDLDNMVGQVDDGLNFKILAAYNPTRLNHEVAIHAEPKDGWASVDLDRHYRWKSKRGWDVLRLDGLNSENVKQNTIIYPGLQTAEGLRQIELTSGGKHTPGYLAMARGMYCLSGEHEKTVFSKELLYRCVGVPIWDSKTIKIAGIDIATEQHRGKTVLAFAEVGFCKGFQAFFSGPEGRVTKQATEILYPKKRLCISVNAFEEAPPVIDIIQLSDFIRSRLESEGILPRFVCIDRTGVGWGVVDYLKHTWSDEIASVNFSEGASQQKIFIEDEHDPRELFGRFNAELAWLCRRWLESRIIVLNVSTPFNKVIDQLIRITYRVTLTTGKITLDVKPEGIDMADAFMLVIAGARRQFGLVPSITGQIEFDPEDHYIVAGPALPEPIVDITNKFELLESQ